MEVAERTYDKLRRFMITNYPKVKPVSSWDSIKKTIEENPKLFEGSEVEPRVNQWRTLIRSDLPLTLETAIGFESVEGGVWERMFKESSLV